jgi:hypothetical protein
VTASVEAAAAAVEPASRTVEVYFRHVFIPVRGSPDPFRVLADSGRWATSWTLYTAHEVHVVWAEYCRSAASDVDRADPTGGVGLTPASLPVLAGVEVGDPLPRRSLYRLTYRFERVADLTSSGTQAELSAAGFDPANFYADDFGLCPELARAGEGLGWQALIAPSAAWRPDGTCTAVLSAGRDALQRHQVVVEAARPTIGIAWATAYRSGERPVWLG